MRMVSGDGLRERVSNDVVLYSGSLLLLLLGFGLGSGDPITWRWVVSGGRLVALRPLRGG